jgi:ribosomal protein RSM22 (predicted rRNA methylase)
MGLEQIISNYLLRKSFLNDDLSISHACAKALVDLSDSFTRGRAELQKGYFADKLHRDAYVAGFVLTNAAKVAHCLAQHLDLLPGEGPLTILDVGCGPGTAILAASEFLARHRPGQEVRFVGVEANRDILNVARELSKDVFPRQHRAEWVAGDIENLSSLVGEKRFDVAIAANALNETPAPARVCRGVLEKSDALIVIDPALKETARGLMALRDHLIENGDVRVVAPCLHQKPCPMLRANDRDWCHFYIEWDRLELAEAMDRATGLDHRYLKLAYMAFVRHGATICHSEGGTTEESLAFCKTKSKGSFTTFRMTNKKPYRVVSSPLHSKGKTELVLCGEDGELRRVRRLDKDASESNADVDRVKRGDIVALKNEASTERVGASDQFQLLKRFNPA